MFKTRQSDLVDLNQKHKTSGRQIWTVLHTYAAYLPQKLSNNEQILFKNFTKSIFHFATKNNEIWKETVKKADEKINLDKLDFSSRDQIMINICHYHNKINWEIGKEQFPCNIEALNELWGSK